MASFYIRKWYQFGSGLKSKTNIELFEEIDLKKIKLPKALTIKINEFAKTYNSLIENNIIRSRRIVGDIGEFYACRRLDLMLPQNKTEKGFDAINQKGVKFEIKTRRVYFSDRRTSEVRRLNNLVGKTADFLIVVTVDHSFMCSGMWLMPIGNISNPKSANLSIVNKTPGTLNLIPSKISWLETGNIYQKLPNSNRSSINKTRTYKTRTSNQLMEMHYNNSNSEYFKSKDQATDNNETIWGLLFSKNDKYFVYFSKNHNKY